MPIPVRFEVDGLLLRGDLHLPATASPPPLVIGAHGLLSDRSSPKQTALARACHEAGIAFLRFDHRGCGESDGTLASPALLEERCRDLLAAIAAMRRRGGFGERLGLFGSSMGGAVCLQTAAAEAIDALVVYAAPVRSAPLRAAAHRPGVDPEWKRQAELLGADFDLAPVLGRIHHVLVIHGDADAVVPVDHGREAADAALPPKRLIVLPDGDHALGDPQHQELFLRESVRWLREHLLPEG